MYMYMNMNIFTCTQVHKYVCACAGFESEEGVAVGNQEMANPLVLNTNSLKQIYLSTAGKGLILTFMIS